MMAQAMEDIFYLILKTDERWQMLSLEKERLYCVLENVGGLDFLGVVKPIKQTSR